jgi:hypothetical protein
MRFWVPVVVLSLSGCGGGGGGSSIAPPPTTTQSIANGRLTAAAANGATMSLQFSGTVAADETATVTGEIPPEIRALETGHNVGSGATLTLGPQPVTLLLDRCGTAFSGGLDIELSLNPKIVVYDSSTAPASLVASVSPVTPHQATLCSGTPPAPPTQTLLPGRRYAVVIEV